MNQVRINGIFKVLNKMHWIWLHLQFARLRSSHMSISLRPESCSQRCSFQLTRRQGHRTASGSNPNRTLLACLSLQQSSGKSTTQRNLRRQPLHARTLTLGLLWAKGRRLTSWSRGSSGKSIRSCSKFLDIISLMRVALSRTVHQSTIKRRK